MTGNNCQSDRCSDGGDPQEQKEKDHAGFDAYSKTRTDPRFTDWARHCVEPVWSETTNNRFTHELAADEIDDDTFRRYLVQDYAFLEALVGAFGHAVCEAPSMAAKTSLVNFLGTLTDEENNYFERSVEALGVPDATDTRPERTATTDAFIDLLERASREGGYAESLAVLVPVEWVYLTWARSVIDRPEYRSSDRFYLAEWIALHTDQSFASFVEWLRNELDREGAMASERRQYHLMDIFRRTIHLERRFFDSVYGEKSIDGTRGPRGGMF